MESRISKAVENKNCGYNCAQAVSCAIAPTAWPMPLNFLKRNWKNKVFKS